MLPAETECCTCRGFDSGDGCGRTNARPKPNVLEEADRIVSGPRQEAYGHPLEDFLRTARLWSAVLGVEVSPQQVALCMVLVKVSRECNRHGRDNLVDIAGYARTLEMVWEKLGEEVPSADSADSAHS